MTFNFWRLQNTISGCLRRITRGHGKVRVVMGISTNIGRSFYLCALSCLALPLCLAAEERRLPGAAFEVPQDAVSLGELDFDTGAIEKSFEVGSLPLARRTTFRLRIKNAGLSDLHIEKVEVGCSCLAATPSHNIIQHGKAEDVYLMFLPTQAGSFTRVANIGFRDGHTISVRIGCKVLPLYSVTPELLSVSAGDTVAKLQVEANFEQIDRIAEISVDSDIAEVIVDTSLDDGRRLLSLELAGFIGESQPNASVAIYVRGASDNMHPFRILIKRTDMLAVSPTRMIVRVRADGERTAVGYVTGAKDSIDAVCKPGTLECQADGGSLVRLGVADTTRISDTLARVTVGILDAGEDVEAVGVLWKDRRSGETIGKSELLLR